MAQQRKVWPIAEMVLVVIAGLLRLLLVAMVVSSIWNWYAPWFWTSAPHLSFRVALAFVLIRRLFGSFGQLEQRAADKKADELIDAMATGEKEVQLKASLQLGAAYGKLFGDFIWIGLIWALAFLFRP